MEIALLANKGGVGKSTLSLLLYEALKMAGRTVVLHDWDIQGTSSTALNLIYGERVMQNPENYDIAIYDTPPHFGHDATILAVKKADVALVVVSPSPADIWEAEKAVQFVRKQNKNAIVQVVFNKVRKGTLLGQLVEEQAKKISAPMVKITLSQRECYQHALGQGWKALDAAAKEEVLGFAVSVTTIKK